MGRAKVAAVQAQRDKGETEGTGRTPIVPASERGKATRRKLLRAAEECFGRHGYAKTSVAEIVRVADVSQGGFYVYFPSKQAIFREVVLDMGEQLRTVTRQAVEQAEDRTQAEVAGAQAYFHWLYEHRDLHRILHQIDEVDPSLAEELYAAHTEPYAAALGASMSKGDIDTVDPELLAYAMLGILHFVAMRWILWENSEFPDTKMKDLETIIRNLLGNRD